MGAAAMRQLLISLNQKIKTKSTSFFHGPLALSPRAAVLALLARMLAFVQDRRCGCPFQKKCFFDCNPLTSFATPKAASG